MISQLLKVTDMSLMLFKQRPSDITIGVPHHTPQGTNNMPCGEHRAGDVNTGFIGQYISERLQTSFVCACNYFLDPNKSPTTDYSTAVAKTVPTYLIEIHGHAKRKTDFDVEISCGAREKEDLALRLKSSLDQLIAEKLESHPSWSILKDITTAAKFNEIYFKATGTATIQDTRWKAFHIELSPRLRKDPNISLEFRELLYQAIKMVCKDAL